MTTWGRQRRHRRHGQGNGSNHRHGMFTHCSSSSQGQEDRGRLVHFLLALLYRRARKRGQYQWRRRGRSAKGTLSSVTMTKRRVSYGGMGSNGASVYYGGRPTNCHHGRYFWFSFVGHYRYFISSSNLSIDYEGVSSDSPIFFSVPDENVQFSTDSWGDNSQVSRSTFSRAYTDAIPSSTSIIMGLSAPSEFSGDIFGYTTIPFARDSDSPTPFDFTYDPSNMSLTADSPLRVVEV